VALRTVESARQAAEAGVAGAPSTSATTSSAAARSDLETDVPTGRASAVACAPRLRSRHRGLLGRSAPDALLAEPRLRLCAPAQRLALAAGLVALLCCCPPARWPLPSSRAWVCASPRRGGCPGSTSCRRAGGRAHHGRRADAADERGAGRGAARAPRGAGPRQPRLRTSTSRCSATHGRAPRGRCRRTRPSWAPPAPASRP